MNAQAEAVGRLELLHEHVVHPETILGAVAHERVEVVHVVRWRMSSLPVAIPGNLDEQEIAEFPSFDINDARSYCEDEHGDESYTCVNYDTNHFVVGTERSEFMVKFRARQRIFGICERAFGLSIGLK